MEVTDILMNASCISMFFIFFLCCYKRDLFCRAVVVADCPRVIISISGT